MINVDEIAAQALANYEPLVSKLANKRCSIYHDNAPENGEYPIVQYTDISETPILHADNEAIAFQKIIRVTIINNTPVGRHELKESVIEAMKAAGFMWQATDTIRDMREYYTVIDFSYGGLI